MLLALPCSSYYFDEAFTPCSLIDDSELTKVSD